VSGRRFPFGVEPPNTARRVSVVEPVASRLTQPLPEGWRAPSRVVPFQAPRVEAPHPSAEPVRETLPEPAPPAPLAGWMILAVVALASAGVSWWLVHAMDPPEQPALLMAPKASAAPSVEAAPPAVTASASAPPVASASAPVVPRRPAPAKRSKSSAMGEIRDPWGAP
jgi:cytoskeletal protein RodZ